MERNARHFAPSASEKIGMHSSINISCLRHSGRSIWLGCLISVVFIFTINASAQQRRVDDPDDQEDLNRELWEFAKNTPYESILSYVKEAQRASRATQIAEVEPPNGWRITPA